MLSELFQWAHFELTGPFFFRSLLILKLLSLHTITVVFSSYSLANFSRWALFLSSVIGAEYLFLYPVLTTFTLGVAPRSEMLVSLKCTTAETAPLHCSQFHNN